MRSGRIAAVVGLSLAVACRRGGDELLVRVAVSSVPTCVLTAQVGWEIVGASTAELVVRRADGTGEVVHRTWIEPSPASGGLSVFGLEAGTDYEAELTGSRPAAGGDVEVKADRASFRSGVLPDALANVQLAVAGTPPPGLILMSLFGIASPAAVVAFDGAGIIRWYRLFDATGPAFHATQLGNGNVVAFVYGLPELSPGEGAYVEVTPLGDEVRRVAAPAPYWTDDHELIVTGEGTLDERLHLFSAEVRDLEWPGIGIVPTIGHRIHRLRGDGSEEWSWSAWDHIGTDEAVDVLVFGGVRDLDHPNSIDVGPDGNYLVSFRDLDSVFRIHASTGEVLWRLGGTRSDFTFVDDAASGFIGQHMPRWLPDGHILLFDNGFLRGWSRAAEYALDPVARTATLVWEGRLTPDRESSFVGSAVRTSSGTLAGFGYIGIVASFDAAGSVTWEGHLSIDGQPAQFYRAIPMALRWDGSGWGSPIPDAGIDPLHAE